MRILTVLFVVYLASLHARAAEVNAAAVCKDSEAQANKVMGNKPWKDVLTTPNQFDQLLKIYAGLPYSSQAYVTKSINDFKSHFGMNGIAEFMQAQGTCAFIRLQLGDTLLHGNLGKDRAARAIAAVSADITHPRVPSAIGLTVDMALLKNHIDQKKWTELNRDVEFVRTSQNGNTQQIAKLQHEKIPDDTAISGLMRSGYLQEIENEAKLRPLIIDLAKTMK